MTEQDRSMGSEPGRITRSTLALGEYPDGSPITAPMLVAIGSRPGPVLWVQACVHGPELVGPLAIHRFLAGLDLAAVHGTILCLLTANPLAYRAQTRLTPQDGMNLNRAFPGRPDGSISEQMAHRAFAEALARADALVDLHSGGDHLWCCFHAIFHNDGSPAGRASEHLARHLGTPRLCNVPADMLATSAFRAFVAAGKPAVLVESGGGARVAESDIDDEVRAIDGACRALGILSGAADAVQTRADSGFGLVVSTRGGIFHARAQPGDAVSRGEELGHLVDLYGVVVERFVCPYAQAWVAAIRRPYMATASGEDIAELVPIA